MEAISLPQSAVAVSLLFACSQASSGPCTGAQVLPECGSASEDPGAKGMHSPLGNLIQP